MAEDTPVTEPEGSAVNEETESTESPAAGSAPVATSTTGEAETVLEAADEPATAPAVVKAAAATKGAAKAAPSSATPAAKPRQASAAAPKAGEGARTTRRKVREGTVISNRMEKTAVVIVIERVRHPRYAKTVQRTKRLYAHDETNDVRVGDRVRLVETRPSSKLKRWRVERVLERAR
jgi:small subunit ribosomal protein S17